MKQYLIPELSEANFPGISEYHLDFARTEFGRGMEYYQKRIRAIDFVGMEAVLDAGCGVGQWAMALAESNKWVYGVDRSGERLEIARRICDANSVINISLHEGDLNVLPFESGKFDLIFCYGVFMFLAKKTAMQEFARVLRPGGRVYICLNGIGWSLYLILERGIKKGSLPLVRAGFDTILRTLRHNLILRQYPAVATFSSPHEMRALLRSNGLDVISCGMEGTTGINESCGDIEPVYQGKYLALDNVFEIIAQSKTKELLKKEPPAPSYFYERAQDYTAEWHAYPASLPTIITAGKPTCDFVRVSRVKKEFSIYDNSYYLNGLWTKITKGTAGDEKKVIEVIHFLQDALYHHPTLQLLREDGSIEFDPVLLLNVHQARCGHVASLACALLQVGGFDTRVIQFRKHVVAEVYYDKKWHMIDADAFKNGIIPRNSSGAILSVAEALENPYQLDRYSPTGYFVRRGTRYTKNSQGTEITGYVDVFNFEDRGYISTFYSDTIEPEFPPSIPMLKPAEILKKSPYAVLLQWTDSYDRDGDFSHYRVKVGTTSKGWSYDNVSYQRILSETGTEVGEFISKDNRLEIEIDKPGSYFWSVKATDSHVKKEPDTFYWCSDEGTFILE